MDVMKSNQLLTDVRLSVGEEIINAHKVVLAGASPYFKVSEYFDEVYLEIFKPKLWVKWNVDFVVQ